MLPCSFAAQMQCATTFTASCIYSAAVSFASTNISVAADFDGRWLMYLAACRLAGYVKPVL
jgi:hypothetical protein